LAFFCAFAALREIQWILLAWRQILLGIGLGGPMTDYAAAPQLTEDVAYRDIHEMHHRDPSSGASMASGALVDENALASWEDSGDNLKHIRRRRPGCDPREIQAGRPRSKD